MLLVLSFVLLFLLADVEIVHTLIEQVGTFGYFGGLLVGIFSVSLFTAAPAYLVLYHLAQEFNPVLLALCGGIGGVLGDLLIFRFLKDGVFKELHPLIVKHRKSRVVALFRSRSFKWLTPSIGALIIISPFPDEVGVGLMGLSKIKTWQFACLAFLLNSAGILAVVLLVQKLSS